MAPSMLVSALYGGKWSAWRLVCFSSGEWASSRRKL